MNPSPTVTTIKYVGLDVHPETVANTSGGGAYGIGPACSHVVDKLVRKMGGELDGGPLRL